MNEVIQHEKPFPYVEIRNAYTESEVSDIMKELDSFHESGSFLPPEQTGSAADDNELLKKNSAVWVDDVYQNRSESPILCHNRKLFSIGSQLDLRKLGAVFRTVEKCTLDWTLVSYYENEDLYKPHHDASNLTALTYFFKQPKKFTGGDLYFPEYDFVLESKFNTTYIFCSLEMHGVTNVVMDGKDEGKCNGRYCMSQFLSFR